MGLPLELPPSLRGRALTRGLLRAHGLNPQRLRGAHMTSLGSGVYVPRHLAERLEPQSLHLLKARAIVAETLLRLALLEAGLPEPELQISLHEDGSGRRADMGYRQARIVIQYEGAGHFDADQLRADQRRDNEFFAAGWVVLRFNAEDLRDRFRRAVTLVRQALAARS